MTEGSKRLDTTALLQNLPELEARAARLRGKELRARRKAERVEQQIRGIRILAGHAPGDGRLPAPPHLLEAAPTGIAAIRRVLGEFPSTVWSAGSLHAELERRGWVSPTARYRLQGTEAAVSRMVRSGELRRVGRGRYRLAGTLPADIRQLPGRVGLDPTLIHANGAA